MPKLVNLLNTALLSGCILLVGCSSGQRYKLANDRAPDTVPPLSSVQQPIPRYEPFSAQGNRNYRVLGKDYKVLRSRAGYVKEGKASWYGKKFHGHLTSNGEIYDMFSFSAAHRSLPLPTFVRVTNLSNQRQVIVRVNDRGPFHDERIIDLSYAAANQLDMLEQGVARVRIEALDIPKHASSHTQTADKDSQDGSLYIQVLASRDENKANQIGAGLSEMFQVASSTVQIDGLYKVRLGPVQDRMEANILLDRLKQQDYHQAFVVTTP